LFGVTNAFGKPPRYGMVLKCAPPSTGENQGGCYLKVVLHKVVVMSPLVSSRTPRWVAFSK